jgi:hypothetical protein
LHFHGVALIVGLMAGRVKTADVTEVVAFVNQPASNLMAVLFADVLMADNWLKY